MGATQVDWSDETWLLVETGKKINVKIEVIPIPHADVADKRSIMIAGESLPDIMSNPDTGSFRTVMTEGPKGAFFPLDTIMDKMPNVKRWADKYPEFNKMLTAGDGHIYALPRINTFDFFDWGLMIKASHLEGSNMTIGDIETIDDLFEALLIIKEKIGAAPWVSRHEGSGPQRFMNMNVQIFGTGENFYYNTGQDKYSFGPLEDNFGTMIEFLSKAYDAGLLNEDVFVMTDEGRDAVINGDQAGFMTDNLANLLWFEGWEALLPPKIDGQRYYGTINQGNIDYDSLWTVAGNTENIDAVARFLDFVYSDEGEEFWTWGEEGYTFEIDEDTGRHMYIWDEEEGRPMLAMGTDIGSLGLYHHDQNQIIFGEEIFDMGWAYDNTRFVEPRQLYIDNNVVPPSSLPVIFTDEEDSSRVALELPIITHTEENIVSFVKGVRPIEEWDTFLNELDGMKVNDLLAIYNTAFDRMYK